MTVEQNIMAVLELAEPDKAARADRLEQLLGEFGLARLRAASAMSLSGGERRRCEIARALAASPSIMLLDEPFAGIDPISIADIRDLVRSEEHTSELQSLMRISYAGFCLKKKTTNP